MKTISLFSGIGGLDLGLEQAGHETIFANDIMKIAVKSYSEYFKKYRNTKILDINEYNELFDKGALPQLPVVLGDISKINKFPNADIVTGGFPCQGFSMIGTRLETDPRNKLYLEFSRVISLVNPKIFIAENVKGLISLYQGRVFEAIQNNFKTCGEFGYNVTCKLLNAKNYGVAQDRERVIIIGVRNDLNFDYKFPSPTHADNEFFGNEDGDLKKIRTLRNEIGRFRKPKDDELYKGKFSPLYMSRNRKRNWNEVSFTIQANAMHVPLHPSSCKMIKITSDKFEFDGQEPFYRRLTPKECLAIQSFPRDFINKIQGSIQQQYTQIGNAVPPRLSYAIASKLPKAF